MLQIHDSNLTLICMRHADDFNNRVKIEKSVQSVVLDITSQLAVHVPRQAG